MGGNRHRGEARAVLGGESYPLRLTLQALAEIETAFGAGDLVALGERLAGGRLAARDVIALLGAVIRGGGAMLDDAALAKKIAADELGPALEAVAALFIQSFRGGADAKANPRSPQGT